MNLRLSNTTCAYTFAILVVILLCREIVFAEQQPINLESRKAQLEVQKLELEISALKKRPALPDWFTAVLGLLVGAVGTGVSVWVARLARRGALDQALHERRIKSYSNLAKSMASFALYFPPREWVRPNDCRDIGEAMRTWYFNGGGLLMSTQARKAYFALARALTRASLTEKLRTPVFPQDALEISESAITKYRRELKKRGSLDFNNVEKWKFGSAGSEPNEPELRFKDFVFLQTLGSRLRTQLSKDLHSRRRPS